MIMADIDLITISARIIVVLLSVVTGLLCWMMQRFIRQIDAIVKDVASIAHGFDDKYHKLDRRITIIETRCHMRRSTDGEGEDE